MKRSLLIGMYFSFLLAAACGGDGKSDKCDNVTCEQGICELKSGECINAPNCGEDSNACLTGYECVNQECTPEVACALDNPCERGTCVDNVVCVNPTSCNTNANCLSGFYCTDENVCSDDLCSDTTCDNGVCELGTGACVNADSCRTETQDKDCLDGFGCVSGVCVNETDYCAELDCKRGVCSFEEQGCIDAPDCAGDDVQCLSGNYCDDQNKCQTNRCDVLNTECPRGVCDPAQGVCVDTKQCTKSTECIDAKVCLDGACTPIDEACGVEGCTGTQECKFDEGTLKATCEESALGCTSALDCKDDRICAMGACAAPVACSDDTFEPNNAQGEETEITNTIEELSLCANDTDLFIFDTTTDADIFGMLNVVVEIESEDVGLGEVKVELVNPLGNVAQSGSSIVNGSATATVDLRHLIDVVTQGKYIIRISGDGVTTAGVRYQVRADVVNPDILRACGMTSPIDVNAPTSGNTSMGGSVKLTTCGDVDGLAKENIFSLQIDAPSYVTLRALPSIGVDVTLSLRAFCAQDDSTIECENAKGESDPEQVGAPLMPGTYFVVVESPQDKEGAYSIVTTVEPVICTTADNTCADATNANVCNDKGTGFDKEVCSNGCDMAINRCTRDPGDVCSTAIPLVNNSYSGEVDFTKFIADYAAPVSCVPEGSAGTEVDGQDAVFAITIPDGSAMSASLEGSFSRNVSMYFVSDCQNIANDCTGVNKGRSDDETLFIKNDSGAEMTGFLIVDRREASTSSSPSDIEISVAPVICTPGESRCVLNRESQVCNVSGTAFDTSITCNFGCDMATGDCVSAANDTCDGAVEITSGVSETGDISILAPSYDNTGCTSSAKGRDAIYVLRNVPVGSLIHTVLDADFDSVVWMARSCDMNALDACVARKDSGNPETLDFVAPDTGDYYIVADTWSPSKTVGTYTITATVIPPQCQPGALLGCLDATTLQYCDASGQIVDLACGGGCSNDQCGTPSGDVCFDAKVLVPNANVQTESGTTDNGGTNAIEMSSSGTIGSCNFSFTTDEVDSFYRIDIPAQTKLVANFTSGWDTTLFMLDSTCDANTCSNLVKETGAIDYFSLNGETIFLVVDTDAIGSTAQNAWSIDYRFVPQPNRVCNNGDSQCNGNTVDICNATQTGFDTFSCVSGCANGACIDDAALTETCATAPDATAGFFGKILIDDHSNDVDGACGRDTDGDDAHFQVSLLPNEIVHVHSSATGSSFHRPVIYFYNDCANPETSCLTSSPSGLESDVYYQAVGAETIFIGIDNESSFADNNDSATVQIEVIQPQCVNGQAPICNGAGDALEICEGGLIKELPCGGNNVCSNNACENPSGDVCFDAIILSSTTPMPITITSTFSAATKGFDADGSTIAGACRFSARTSLLKDRIFKISLVQGDRLKIDHDGSVDTHVAFVEDCTDATTCLSSNRVPVDDVMIEFVAPTTREYSIIFRNEDSSSSSFSFDYEVISGSNYVCHPNAFYCLDATTVAACNDVGKIRSQYTCTGGCADGACVDTAASTTCGGATLVTGGGYFLKRLEDGTEDVNLTDTSCVGETTPGGDFFYRVDMKANEIIDVRVQAFYDFEDPAIYIFTDCTDAETSCLTGTGTGDAYLSLNYQSPIDQTVYVGLDSRFSGDDDWMGLEIEVRQPDCMPGVTAQVCTADTTGFEYCDETGFTQVYDCGGAGMCDAASNRCTNPVGDTCFDAYNATPAVVGTPETFTGSMGDNANTYSLSPGNSCTGSATPAKDQVYVVDLTMGQTLDVSLVSSAGTPEDIAMYLTTDCGSLPGSCLAGADTQPAGLTPETLTYTATAATETVYIVVDSFFVNTSGSFDLTVGVN